MPTILSPVPPVVNVPASLAPRPVLVAGMRIGILDNSKANAARLLDSVVSALVEGHGAVRSVGERKSSSGVPATPGALARLSAEADLVLTASADCGSCTSACIQDTIALERLGIPCILLGTTEFESLGSQLAEWLGLAGIQRAITSHPLGGIPEEAVDAKAREMAEQIVALLATSE